MSNIHSNTVHISPLVEEFTARPTDRDTISLETLSLGSYDVSTMAEEYPDAFLRALSRLGPVDQQLLLSYHVLKSTQTSMGKIFGYTQTNIALQLWIASRRLAYHLLFTDPTAEELRPLLQRHGLEQSKLPLPTSELVAQYLANRDWDDLDELCENARTGKRDLVGLRIQVRSTLRRIRQEGMVTSDTRLQSLGSHLDSIPGFRGDYRESQRQQREETDVYIVHPECLGEFRVDVTSPGFGSWMTTRASGPHAEEQDD